MATAEELVAAAQACMDARDVNGAIANLRAAREFASEGSYEAARLDYTLARRYEERGEWPLVRDHARAAYVAPGAADNPGLARAARLALAGALAHTGEDEEALGELLEMEAELLAVPPGPARSEAFIEVWNRLGEVSLRLGRLDEARARFEGALRASEPRRDMEPEMYAATLSHLSAALHQLGRPQDALRRLQEARSLVERESEQEGRLLTNLADVHRTLGELVEAEGCVREAIRIQEAWDRTSESMAKKWNQLGLVYEDERRHELAEHAFRRSLELHKQAARNSRETASTTANLARSLMGRQRLDEARTHLREAVAIHRSHGIATPDGASALAMLGLLERELGAQANASDPLEEARTILESVARDSRELGNVYHHLAYFAEQAGDIDEALRLNREAMSRREAAGSPVDVAASLKAFGRLARRTCDLEQAIERFSAAVDVAERVRSAAGQPTTQESLFRHHQTAYQELIACLHARGGEGDAEKALEYSERSRGRALLDMLNRRTAEPNTDPHAAELVAAERRLRVELAKLHAQAAAARLRDEREGDDALSRRIRDVEIELHEVGGRLLEAFPAYRELEQPGPVGIASIRERLGPRTLLLEFDATGSDTFVWAVRNDRFGMYPLGGTDAEIDEAVGWVVIRFLSGAPRSITLALAGLTDALLAPVPHELWVGVDELVIVADGSLHYLPFELLPAPFGDGTLLDHYNISYAPSASVWVRLRDRAAPSDPASRALAAFANPDLGPESLERWKDLGLKFEPLADSEEEVSSIAEHFLAGSDVCVGPQATEWRVRELVGGRSHVHFATHGLFDDRGAAYSGLLLASPAEAEVRAAGDVHLDDFLQAFEMPELPLDAELVVLSACVTAIGHVHEGEGLVGMVRTLLAAGARCVIASLWLVPDRATARLMAAMYREHMAGADIATALRRAKLGLRDGEFPEPENWAGFLAYGLAN